MTDGPQGCTCASTCTSQGGGTVHGEEECVATVRRTWAPILAALHTCAATGMGVDFLLPASCLEDVTVKRALLRGRQGDLAQAWRRGLLRGTAVWAVEGAGVKGKGAFPAGSRLWDGETGRWGLGDVGTLPTFFTAHCRSCLGSPDSTGSVVGLNFAMSREDLVASGLLGGGGQDLHPRTVGLVGRKDRSQAQGPSPHLEPTMLQPRCRGLLPPLPLSPWLPVTPS